MNKSIRTLLIIMMVFGQLISCSADNNSINSKDLSREDRVAKLNKVILSPFEFIDCDYDLFRTGGFDSRTAQPIGPTDYDYKFVVKISPAHVGNWTEGMKVSTKSDGDEMLIKHLTQFRKNLWETHTEPKFYEDQYCRVILYKNEGIVFKHYISY